MRALTGDPSSSASCFSSFRFTSVDAGAAMRFGCGRRAGCLYLMPVMALSSLISVSSAVA